MEKRPVGKLYVIRNKETGEFISPTLKVYTSFSEAFRHSKYSKDINRYVIEELVTTVKRELQLSEILKKEEEIKKMLIKSNSVYTKENKAFEDEVRILLKLNKDENASTYTLDKEIEKGIYKEEVVNRYNVLKSQLKEKMDSWSKEKNLIPVLVENLD